MARRLRFLPFLTFVAVLALGAGAWVGVTRFRQVQADSVLPVATARKGEFLVMIRCRGDLKALRSVPIYAPIVPNLSIAWLAPAGEEIQKGEPVIRFDSSSAQQQLAQKEADLKQAQATLDHAQGEARNTAERDRTELADAKYNVEKARLQTTASEFGARLAAEQAAIDLNIAEQKFRVQEANVALHAASDKAKIASLTRQRDQALADIELTKRRIAQMAIRAPITGFLEIRNNYSQGPLSQMPFKVGDNVYSGMNLAEMPDLTSLVMDARAEEIDRGRIGVGQEVRVRVDALPELTIPAKITGISPLAETTDEWPPTRNFRAYAALQNVDPRLRPGMNGGMDIIINRIQDAISIPSKAVFTRAGKPVVYLVDRGRYTPVEIELLARNPDEVAVSGIPAGAIVALTEPERSEAGKSEP
jgi:multidrug efflux pump subunit AcrA (membrane-fusion protein)